MASLKTFFHAENFIFIKKKLFVKKIYEFSSLKVKSHRVTAVEYQAHLQGQYEKKKFEFIHLHIFLYMLKTFFLLHLNVAIWRVEIKKREKKEVRHKLNINVDQWMDIF